MNREDIIRMARESGMELYGLGKDREKFLYYVERFAQIAYAAGAAAEREACAKVCEAEADATDAHLHLCIDALRDCAYDIRARGQA